MSTPRQILGFSYGRSKANKGASDIDEPTEGLGVVQGALDRLYTLTARVNPDYYGVIAAVNESGGKYVLPSKAERVIKIERNDGTEVVVVSPDDKKLFVGRKPALYFLGRGYLPAGNAIDPNGEPLTFRYAPGAPVLAIDTDIPDTAWPAQFNGLLVDESAVYLSLKDRRVGEDLSPLKQDRDAKALLYIAHLEHVNSLSVRRTGTVPRFPSSLIGEVMLLLAGNSPGETP